MKYYNNYNSSIFICLMMSTIVSHLNDWHKTLTQDTYLCIDYIIQIRMIIQDFFKCFVNNWTNHPLI